MTVHPTVLNRGNQCKITRSTGMATPNATRGYFGEKSHSHWHLVKQRQLKSQQRRKQKAEIVL